MNKGVIFFVIIVLAILAIVFIPKNKDGVPANDANMEAVAEDQQASAIESVPGTVIETEASAELPAVDAGAEGVVEVPATETTPAVTE